MKYLVLGINGMLGHVLFSKASSYGEVRGTVRQNSSSDKRIYSGISADDLSGLEDVLKDYRPDIIINCIGIIKQLKESKDPIPSIKINSLFPHELAKLAANYGAKVIHFSTDCVFKGDKGHYADTDPSDAEDLYGRTKFLGEIGYENSLTLRTSIIGHELNSYNSLVDWFLSQGSSCKGYSKAIYTGFPTIAMAEMIFETMIPAMEKNALHGVHQISSEPISKYDLLKLIAKVYGKRIEIIQDDTFVLDRSLNSEPLRKTLGLHGKSWEQLIQDMHQHFLSDDRYLSKKDYKIESL